MAEYVGVPKKMISIRKFSYSFFTYPVMIWLGCWELIGRSRMDIHISEIYWNISHQNVRFFISCGMFEICCFTSRTLVYVCSNRTPAAGPSITMINLGWKSTRATFNGPPKKSLRGLGLWLEYFCLPQVAKPSGFWSKLGTFRFWTMPPRIFKVSPLGPWAPRYQEDIKGPTNEGSLLETPIYQQS